MWRLVLQWIWRCARSQAKKRALGCAWLFQTNFAKGQSRGSSNYRGDLVHLGGLQRSGAVEERALPDIVAVHQCDGIKYAVDFIILLFGSSGEPGDQLLV
jgi:hypothetical protein